MPNDISDLRSTIVPKSDQLNAEQLLNGPMTITVSDVRMGGSDEQPIAVHYPNDGGRPFKPCKTMRKVLIFCWGKDGRDWVGKSMTLYNDPAVAFGGMKVGGIRISHMTDIEKTVNVSLTATKGKKALHTIAVLERVSLADVMRAIKDASNKVGMEHAKAMAVQLTIPAEIDRAQEAYAAKVQELKARAKGHASTNAPPTHAQLLEQVRAAKTLDEAQAAIARGAHLTDDEQAELRATAAEIEF